MSTFVVKHLHFCPKLYNPQDEQNAVLINKEIMSRAKL